jgi:hypothetical protein
VKTITIGLVLALASPPAPASPELAPPPSPAEPAPPSPPARSSPPAPVRSVEPTPELAPPPSPAEPAPPPEATDPVTQPETSEPAPSPEATEPAQQPIAAQPVKTTAVTTEPATDEPAWTHGDRRPGDRMVKAGVGVVIAGVLGYVVMAAGLGMGNRAQGELFSLPGRDDIEARREVLARGQLGNRLAIGGAIAATAAMAVGIPLILIGRRRHQAASPHAMVRMSGSASGLGLQVVSRF